MADEYKPGLGETVMEMGRDVTNNFGISKIGRTAASFTGAFVEVSLGMLYACPTVMRRVGDSSSRAIPLEGRNKFGVALGATAGVLADVAQLFGYGYLSIKYDHPEVWAIPVATNLVSAVYEWGRKARKRVAERRTKEAEQESPDLEGCVGDSGGNNAPGQENT